MPARSSGLPIDLPLQDGSGAGTRVVDLSLLIAEELPCFWSSHMPYQQKTFNFFADEPGNAAPLFQRVGPYQTRWLLLDEHTGTHVDAPAHFIPEPGTGLPHAAPIGSVTAEQLPMAQLMGPAVVVDVGELPPAEPGSSPIIGPEVILRFEAEHFQITSGDIVLLRRGWDKHYLPTTRPARSSPPTGSRRTGPR